jgi:hypothetical protein
LHRLAIARQRWLQKLVPFQSLHRLGIILDAATGKAEPPDFTSRFETCR